MTGLQVPPLSVQSMNSAYLCPLSTNSRFYFSKLRTQRNWNATDVDARTFDDAKSFYSTYHYGLDNQMIQLPGRQARVTLGGEGTRATKAVEDSGVNKRVGFAAYCKTGARIRSKSLLLLRRTTPTHESCLSTGVAVATAAAVGKARPAASARCFNSSVRLALADSPQAWDSSSSTVSSLLVPLTHNNQSNLHTDRSAYNAATTQETPTEATKKEQNGCDVGAPSGSRDQRDILAGSGMPYWNVYEYQDFRELQHGQSHVFDPMTDPNLHRESIILDSYNKLVRNNPRFRMPVPMYHVR